MYLASVILGICCMVFTLISLLGKDQWWVRMFDLPRVQLTILSVAASLGLFLFAEGPNAWAWLLIGLLAVNISYQCIEIVPFTRLGTKQVHNGKPFDPKQRISVLTANVLGPNRSSGRLLKIIELNDPDIILTLETDKWWEDALAELENERPFTLKHPLDNLYGLHLYSRFPLRNVELRFLVEDDVPSVKMDVELPSGAFIRFYGLHPRPPAPGENETSIERDAELITVAKEVEKDPRPTIVAGDLNDVAWSYTTKLFQRISGLLDPRRGRGFYNTFHAKYPFLRYPLDHIFHSEELKLIALRRLGPFGSDHFPMFIDLEYSPRTDNGDLPPTTDHEEREDAEEVISKAKGHGP